jgi:hypothetical protein
MNQSPIIKLLCASLVLVLSSCASVKDSEEFKTLDGKVSQLESEISTLEADIDARGAAMTRLGELKEARERLIQRFEAVVADPAERQRIVTGWGIDACTRYTTAKEQAAGVVNLDYKTNDAYWAKVRELARPADQILGNTQVSEDSLPGIKAYAAALAATGCARKAVDAFYDNCETFDKLVMNKNPEAFTGKCVRGTVRIAQFDTNTGPCAFQGYLGGGYDVRAQFGETLDPETHSTVKYCPWTSDLVEDNFITYWAWGLGAFTYDTSNGGKQTIPAFKIVMYR